MYRNLFIRWGITWRLVVFEYITPTLWLKLKYVIRVGSVLNVLHFGRNK